MGFALNQVIGNYECLGILEKRRTGITYKVRNLLSGEIEALRALPPALISDGEASQRLLREIRLQTRLNHPNVIAFHDAFQLDGQVVMTTDYVEGPTLADLCRERPLSISDACAAILQVLDGLEEAHALGIVHRGITAEHIIVNAEGVAKVAGFDLAKAASDTHLTQLGSVLGDPRYVSPEQVLGRLPLDARADLYSAGVLFYLTLTAKMPFQGASDIELMTAHVKTEPKPPSAWNPAVPGALDAIVAQALRKKPEERFASARQFSDAVATALETMAASSAPSRRKTGAAAGAIGVAVQ